MSCKLGEDCSKISVMCGDGEWYIATLNHDKTWITLVQDSVIVDRIKCNEFSLDLINSKVRKNIEDWEKQAA